MATIVGFVEILEANRIAGWATTDGSERETVTVECDFEDGKPLTTVAEIFRRDVQNAGIGDGRHGFDLRIEDRSIDGFKQVIAIAADGTRKALPQLPPRPPVREAAVEAAPRDNGPVPRSKRSNRRQLRAR